MQIRIKKRNGELEPLDITKIQKVTIPATDNLSGVSQSEIELDAQIQFVDGMSSVDINNALIKTAVDKTDIDVPNWTFVASRIFLYDLYHRVGISTNGRKGKSVSKAFVFPISAKVASVLICFAISLSLAVIGSPSIRNGLL